MAAHRPVTILIAALGGEGGGVLADWLVDAANALDLPVQTTSIPGVSQRTGATTYYIEIYPVSRSELRGRHPVLALTPCAGQVDLAACTEFVEAARLVKGGFVTADRTTLVTSTHRVFSTPEKSTRGDGRFDDEKIRLAAAALSRQLVAFDMSSRAAEAGTVINAVLFGAMLGSGALPLTREACESAIRHGGKGAEASLRGFALGFDAARAAETGAPAAATQSQKPSDPTGLDWVDSLPAEVQTIVVEGARRLTDYQDSQYADLYLQRLVPFARLEKLREGDWKLTREAARYLALWMSYEDLVRVAQHKTRRSRFARVRAEVGARPSEPVRVVEFLKPGLDEFCSVLPTRFATWVRRTAPKWGLDFNVGLHVTTTSVTGFLLMRTLAGMRRFRRSSSRFAEEQANIIQWLALAHVHASAGAFDVALEVVECARLVKGYGDTHKRGMQDFRRITALAGTPGVDAAANAAAVRTARLAALADSQVDDAPPSQSTPAPREQVIQFLPKPGR